MHSQLKIFVLLFLSLFALTSYAIEIKVHSPSSEVAALGFTVNGKNYGGAGKSYSKSGMPAGVYTFGVRVGGLFGTDVGCATRKGKQSVMLQNDTTAVLNYQGNRCIMQIDSKK